MKTFVAVAALLLCVRLAFGQYSVNQKVEVFDPIEKKWFPSTILQVDGQKYFIHYKGYDPKWDVWVDPSLIRKPGEAKESPILYLIGSTESLYSYYVKEQIYVDYLSPDSMAFRAGSNNGDYYSFKRQPGMDFLLGNQKIYESKLYVVPIDNNSFMLTRSHNNLSYYNRNKEEGTTLMNNKELGKYVDAALEHIHQIESKASDDASKLAADNQFAAISRFVKNYVSKKNDPALINDITKWWNGTGKVINPLLKVYIANGDYTVQRNDLGIILNKHVTALLVYHWQADNKCYVKWQNFGYENMGGSTYSTELKTWAPNDVVFNMENQRLNAGQGYVLDCNSVKP